MARLFPVLWEISTGRSEGGLARESGQMVLIPAGEFQMGSNDLSNEKPVHVDAFYMDKYEATNSQ